MTKHKKIGFIDYRLDNFHADVYLKALRGPLADRHFEVAGATALIVEPSATWCQENGVPYFESVEALAPHVDYFLVLAPSNPETHPGLCDQAFRFGKVTFVDKTFATDGETALQIFAAADRHGIPVQTTSALRNTDVQLAAAQLGRRLRHLSVTSGGASWNEYGIHPVELVVSCMGHEVEAIMRLGQPDLILLVLKFSDQRTAVINFNPAVHLPFAAELTSTEEILRVQVDDQRLFTDAARAILDFFEAGRPLIDRRQTLAVRSILDVALSASAFGEFAPLPEPVSTASPCASS